MAEQLVALARAAERVGVTFETAVDSPADGMCRRAGLREDIVVELNRADARIAKYGMLADWIATGEAAPGYTLISFDNRCPEELAAGLVAARHVMNDAPR